jgi:hypothetical protein
MPARFGGWTLGPVILIRPRYKGDVGLLEHEKVHVHQFWRSFCLFGIAYFLSKKKRLQYEAEAYKEQLKYSPQNRLIFAGFLVNNYKLGITQAEALAALE